MLGGLGRGVRERQGWLCAGRGWAERGSHPQVVPVGRVLRGGSDGLWGWAETPQTCFTQGCVSGGWHGHGAHAAAQLEAGEAGRCPTGAPQSPSPSAGLWGASRSITAASAPPASISRKIHGLFRGFIISLSRAN